MNEEKKDERVVREVFPGIGVVGGKKRVDPEVLEIIVWYPGYSLKNGDKIDKTEMISSMQLAFPGKDVYMREHKFYMKFTQSEMRDHGMIPWDGDALITVGVQKPSWFIYNCMNCERPFHVIAGVRPHYCPYCKFAKIKEVGALPK